MILLLKNLKRRLCSTIISFTSGFKREFKIHIHVTLVTHTVTAILFIQVIHLPLFIQKIPSWDQDILTKGGLAKKTATHGTK